MNKPTNQERGGSVAVEGGRSCPSISQQLPLWKQGGELHRDQALQVSREALKNTDGLERVPHPAPCCLFMTTQSEPQLRLSTPALWMEN